MNFGDHRLPERFWNKCSPCPMTGCWLWLGNVNRDGYGKIRWGSRSDGTRAMPSAHQVSYEVALGKVPPGMELDHRKCRTRSCCNPAHLEAVTHAENVRRAVRIPPTHCPYGHEYTPENVVLDLRRGYPDRTCKTCRRRRARDRGRRIRAEQRKAA